MAILVGGVRMLKILNAARFQKVACFVGPSTVMIDSYLFIFFIDIYIYIFIQTALWHTLQHLHIAGISNALVWVDACHPGSQKPNQMVELD